ncbi:hypothetical protein BLOT_001674 [Blomia tropicalis]|nr:hypothetical protein BLOT_001674 [Blomia tropicalis]
MQPHSVVVYFFLVIFTFVNVNCQWNTNEENISPESESIVLVRIRFFGPTRELTSGDGNQPFLGQPISMPHFLRLHAPVQQTLLVPEQTSLRIWQLLPPTNNQPSSIESNAENPQISNDPPSEQDDPKTGSPFDFLTNMLDEEKDLTKTRKSLQVPEAKDLINKYGENLTLFAPNDKAFDDAVQDGSNDEELEKNFVDNHFIVGQRVPIFPSKPTMFDSIDDYPKVLRPNIIVPGGPLVHIIDRVNTKPFNAMSILTMQPAVSAMLKLIKTFDMTNILDKPTSFFCPDNQIINNILQSPKTIPEIVKRFISDHIIESPNPGCHHAMRSSSGRPVSCVETSTNIILNGRIFEKRKVPTLTGVVFIIPGVMFDDADYLPQLFASKQPQKFKLVLIPINETIANKPLIKLPFYQPNDEDKPKSPRQVEPEENATTTEMGETDLEENPIPSEPNNPKQQNFNENDNNKEPDKPDLNKNWSTEPSELSTEAPNNPIESNPVNPLTNPAVDDEPEFNNEPTEEPNYPEETISPINPNVNTENSKQPIDSVTPRPRVKPNQPLNDDNNPIQTPTPLNDEPNYDDPYKLEPESLNDDPTEEPPKRNRPRQDDPKDSIEEETPRISRPNNEPSTEPPSDDYEPVEEEPPKQPKQKPTKKKTPKRPKPNDKPSTEPPFDDYEPVEDEPPKRPKPKPTKEKPKRPKPNDKPSTEPPSDDYEPVEDEPPKRPKTKPSTEPPLDDYELNEEEPPKRPKLKPTKEKPKRPKPNDKPSTEPPSDDYDPVEDEPPKRPETKLSTKAPLDDYEPYEDKPPKQTKPKPTKERRPKKPILYNKPSTEQPLDDYEPVEDELPKQPKPKPTQENSPKKSRPNVKLSTESPFDDYDPIEEEPTKRPKPKQGKPLPRTRLRIKPTTEPPLDDYDPFEEEPNPTPSRRTTRRPSTEPDYEEETSRLKNRRKPTRRPSKPISDDTQRTTTTTETYTEEPYEITSTTSKPQLPPFPPTPSSMMEQEPIEQKPDDSYMPDFEPSNIVPNIDPSQIKQMLGKSAQKLKCGRFFDWLINSGVLDDLLRKYGNKNCTVFMPIDNAASKLPFDMMQTLNNEPQRQKQLMQLHTVPDSFQQIYPSQQQSPSSFRPVPTMNSNQLRFDRSLLKNQNGQYVPLLSGCPMLDSHQIGPIRMVSLGSVIFPPQPNVYSVMKRSPNLRLCREIVDQSGMGPLMRDPKQSFTFFTPSDKALQKRYSQRQLNSLVQDPNACKNFVNQHMIKNRMVYANSLPLSPEQELDPNFGGRTIAMRSNSNDPLRIRRTAQSLFVNDAHVGFQDISCKNGVMHVMNDYF